MLYNYVHNLKVNLLQGKQIVCSSTILRVVFKMYVRAVIDIDDWQQKSLDDVKANLLKNWTDDEPEYSIFRIENINDTQNIKNIVLRLIIENPRKWKEGFQLLVLEDEFLLTLPEIKPDESERYNCLHANITNATYDTFKKCVDYTYKNSGNETAIIYCDFDFIGDLICSLSNSEFSWYINQKATSTKNKKQTYNNIRTYYFKESNKNYPEYID